MKRIFYYCWLLPFFTAVQLRGQNCLPTNINGTVINFSCTQTCTDLKFQVPHLKSSANYAVSSIPYQPYQYVTAAGEEDSSLYEDDQYSNIISIPFQFCFFDSFYQHLSVGSNGIMTFDEANAGCNNAFKILTKIPSDGGGGNICSRYDNYYPRACIMSAFSDLDPTEDESLADRKIEWRVEGASPCRKFIVSYYHVGTFTAQCSTTEPNDFQIILYESTGLIDVLIGNKTCTSATSNGKAILGIQNWRRDKAVTAPGKNAINWTAQNEAFRFTPNGAESRFAGCELYTMDGLLAGIADTVTTKEGLLDIKFRNICMPPLVSSVQYMVKTTFSRCAPNDPTLISFDTITLNRPVSDTLTINTTDATCTAGSTGTITVASPVGASYQYAVNGGTYQSAAFFNVKPGIYIASVKNTVTSCITSDTIIINSASLLTATAVIKDASCAGISDGTITINATQGAAPYTYALDAGIFQSSNIFDSLASGTYAVEVKDQNGCSFNFLTTVKKGIGVSALDSVVFTACSAVSTGKIFVKPSTGTVPVIFSMDSGATYQAAGSFTNLSAGTYPIKVKDALGCIYDFNSVIGSLPGIVTDPSTVKSASCGSVPNGSITLNVIKGEAPFSYTVDSVTQASNIFSELLSGTYDILITDNIGCSKTITEIVGDNPKIKIDSLNILPVSCKGLMNGSIEVNVSLGAEPYQFELDSVGYQPDNLFDSIGPGNYTIHIIDGNNCMIDTAITITEPDRLTASIISTERATCSGTADGKIAAGAEGGTLPYQYTLDLAGLAGYQDSGVFRVTAGNYKITLKDINGCTAIANTRVDTVFNMFLDLGNDTTICVGQNILLKPNTNAETNSFEYSPAVSLNDATLKNPSASPAGITKYLLLANWGICQLTDSITISVLYKPIVNAGNDTAICNNTTALLHGTATGVSGGFNYTWSPVDDLAKTDTLITSASPAATQSYTLTLTDNYGCNFIITDDVLVTVQPPVPAFAGNDTSATTGIPFQLMASGAGTGGKYEWLWHQPGVSLSNSYIANPVATFQNHMYELMIKVTDKAACVGYDTVTIKVYDGPAYYVPNAFTPNGDQLNQVFRALPVGIASTEWFRIFNRFGQLVFETNQLMTGWNGTYKGKPQPTGTYVWLIKGKDRNGRVVEQKGAVLLLR